VTSTWSAAVAAELPPTLDATEVARLWTVGKWAVYDGAAAGTLPVAPIRIGRALRWPTVAVLRSVGMDPAQLTRDQEASASLLVRAPVDHACHGDVTPPNTREAAG